MLWLKCFFFNFGVIKIAIYCFVISFKVKLKKVFCTLNPRCVMPDVGCFSVKASSRPLHALGVCAKYDVTAFVSLPR